MRKLKELIEAGKIAEANDLFWKISSELSDDEVAEAMQKLSQEMYG